jgi:hypothetical protein
MVGIDAAGADVKQLPTSLNLFRWTNTPGTHRLKEQFDGDWPSLRSKNRTKRAETSAPCLTATMIGERPALPLPGLRWSRRVAHRWRSMATGRAVIDSYR